MGVRLVRAPVGGPAKPRSRRPRGRKHPRTDQRRRHSVALDSRRTRTRTCVTIGRGCPIPRAPLSWCTVPRGGGGTSAALRSSGTGDCGAGVRKRGRTRLSVVGGAGTHHEHESAIGHRAHSEPAVSRREAQSSCHAIVGWLHERFRARAIQVARATATPTCTAGPRSGAVQWWQAAPITGASGSSLFRQPWPQR
jgi:hypothetical protein